MKQTLLSLALVVVAGSVCMAGEVKFGDSQETVTSVLGQPEGCIQTEHQSILFYERGRVELVDGRVVSAKLISPEAAEARRLERMRQDELARQAAAKRTLEGRNLRDRKLSDPAFLALPADSRAAYWQEFMQNYPGVAVGMDYDVARRELQAQADAMRAEANRAQQVAELQQQAFEAQQRAADAEARAQQSYASYPSYSYPIFVHSSHRMNTPRIPFCPPEPRRLRGEMTQGFARLPMSAHVGASPNPRDYMPDDRWDVSFHSRR
jgi:hypothetical protein